MPDALTANAFAKLVQQAESEKNPDTLAAQFADDATLEAPVRGHTDTGGDGARSFWQHYLDAFETVRSEFSNIHSIGNTGVLEWESTGKLKGGTPIKYKGVSIVEFAAGKVKRFATYYDSAAFTSDGSRHAEGRKS
jgi:ketosteroid isomerase-like protein